MSASKDYPFGLGIATPTLARLQYNVLPEAVGIQGNYLAQQVDSLANLAIQIKGTPGAVVLIAKEGKVIYHKAYGNQIYETTEPLKNQIFLI